MPKKLYRVYETKTDYRVSYVWARSKDDIRCALAGRQDTPSWEPEGYTWRASEINDYEYVPSHRVLNPEDKE